jgi:hypothetical protein
LKYSISPFVIVGIDFHSLLMFAAAFKEKHIMANAYASHVSNSTPAKVQVSATSVIPGREAEMGRNNGGGVSFLLDQWGVLDRFLVLGSESAGYYVTKKQVMTLAFENLKKCVRDDGLRVVARALEYSLAGRAPKNDPAVVAIAVAASIGSDEVKAAAFDALPKIARTGTWLFLFVSRSQLSASCLSSVTHG